MFTKSQIGFLALSVLSVSKEVLGRERWLERNNRAVFLHPRRFGQEHPAVIDQLSAACPGEVCGNLAGAAITPLLAAQGECTQQDMADQIIDAAAQFDADTQANMIQLAIEYRQVEKNTPPDFSTNPPIYRNSVFCQKVPKNSQLNGLVQAQDPANDPDIFFDPALQASVTKGSQVNTFPFGTDGSASSSNSSSAAASSSVAVSSSAAASSSATVLAVVSSTSADSSTAATATDDEVPCVTSTILVTVTSTVEATSTTSAAASASATAITVASNASIGNFGSCSVPQIEFATGFDNRKETSFQPVDKTSYNHGSAQNIDIITQFICDTLTNSCGADDTAKATCAQAKAAADTGTTKTGIQADLFNAVFGISTDFAAVPSVDDQGNIIAGTGSTTTTSASASSASATTITAASNSSSIGDFGSCTVPQIEFATGFDNRKETSFQPVDKTSYNHGSAQNIDIITQFICDTLTNSCGADATAKATCAQAKVAADTGAAKTGVQADLFNAVFGITTDFAAVPSVDDQGNTISGTGSSSTAAVSSAASSAADASTTAAADASTSAAATSPAAAASTAEAVATSTSAAATSTSSASSSTSGNLQTFTGALGGVTAPAVTAIGNGQFQVEGNSAFNNEQNALVRSCDVQHNQCANAANASGNKGDLTVDACGTQQTQCNAVATATA